MRWIGEGIVPQNRLNKALLSLTMMPINGVIGISLSLVCYLGLLHHTNLIFYLMKDYMASRDKRAQRSKLKAKQARKAKQASIARQSTHYTLNDDQIRVFQSLPQPDPSFSYVKPLIDEMYAGLCAEGQEDDVLAFEFIEIVTLAAASYIIWSENNLRSFQQSLIATISDELADNPQFMHALMGSLPPIFLEDLSVMSQVFENANEQGEVSEDFLKKLNSPAIN
ncbi:MULTISPECIES: hypothetical protein [Aeromonas]|uniref:hypothetical protein n=1 Tax=Aeromonas TaxID=642 RepID=UPI001FD66A33|nr:MULTISPECIES: hypothetical protein [Aeromonas]MCJ8214007.1 hypothetical protein [Aeromonas veronii]USP60322.1 hypothetical protein J6598_10715 [Aeromonas veronii]